MKLYFIIIAVLLFASCESKETKQTTTTNREARQNIVYAEEINAKIKNNKEIFYTDAVIIGDIDFTLSQDFSIESPDIIRHYRDASVMFSNCTFQGKVKASTNKGDKRSYLFFRRNINFLNCTFQETVNFKEARFDHLTMFTENVFQDSVSYQGALFNYKQSYFYGNSFLAFADFARTNFRGQSSFLRSKFHQNILFQSAVFYEDANFGAINIHGRYDFSLCSFRGGANFNFAAFQKTGNFNNSKFYGIVQLSDINAEERLEMENCMFLMPLDYKKTVADSIISFKNSRFILEEHFE